MTTAIFIVFHSFMITMQTCIYTRASIRIHNPLQYLCTKDLVSCRWPGLTAFLVWGVNHFRSCASHVPRTYIHVSIKCVEISGRSTIACSYSICYIYNLYFALNFGVYSYLAYVPLFTTRLEFSCWNRS